MKKIKILVVFISIFFLLASVSFAHEEESGEEANQTVKYDLPYPGLLPDNPFYKLKAARDKVVSFMISDPLKKAEFDLLQADKRLNAGFYLFNKDNKNMKNINLAVSTISKGENYFEEALEKVKEGKMQGLNTIDLERNLLTASKKHQEVIQTLAKKTSGNESRMFILLHERVEEFEKIASASLPKKQ